MLTVTMVELFDLLLSATTVKVTDEALLQYRHYFCTVFKSFQYSPD